ncbi:MAG: NAD(P)H-dependent oxidoreductase, partial [Anaerovoracaceae bacterium]
CKATGSCVHSEDTNEIIEKVAAADCIIFATPVYWWGVSAQLKLALDKFYSRSEALKKKTKKIGIIAIGEDTLDGPQYDLISKQFRCICEYLNWELVLDQAICAGGPEDLSKDKAQLEKLSHWGQQL